MEEPTRPIRHGQGGKIPLPHDAGRLTGDRRGHVGQRPGAQPWPLHDSLLIGALALSLAFGIWTMGAKVLLLPGFA